MQALLSERGCVAARVPRTQCASLAFYSTTIPHEIARRIETHLANSAGDFTALEHDRQSCRAIWVSATSQEVLFVTISDVTQEHAAAIHAAIIGAGAQQDPNAIARLCAAVRGSNLHLGTTIRQ